jgi:hypothetical protein
MSIQTLATLSLIQEAAKRYAAARAVVSERATALESEIAEASRRKLPGIRKAIAEAADHQANLVELVKQNPDLFVQPKTMTLHGIRFGFAKGKGAVEWTVEDEVLVTRLEKMFRGEPELLEQLVKTTKKPIVGGLKELGGDALAKLGVTIEETGEYVFVKAADSEADKLVKRLLKEGAVEEAEPAAAAK